MTQVPTSHNMLFHVEDGTMTYYYKYVIDDSERTMVMALCSELNTCAHAVRHDLCGPLNSVVRKVFKIPCLIPSLTLAEVERCFVKLTGDAIKAVHKLQFAHMDIRVPNVCFGYNQNRYINRF